MIAARTSAVGDLVKRFRLAAGLTQVQLAKQAGLSARGLSDIERGLKPRPHRETIALLADALNLTAAERALLTSATGGGTSASVRPNSAELSQPNPPTERATPVAGRHNLPVQLSSFVGREPEMAEIQELFSTTRLLTLIGTGGGGKTRLALEVARRLVPHYPDGVWLAELAPLSDPSSIGQVIAASVGLHESAGRPTQSSLLAVLSDRRMLLVLDNCEHVLGACAQLVAPLLLGCPGLRILATSREPLRIAGEVAWPVPSLPLPPPDARLGLAEIAAFDAVRLFVERATAVQPSFGLTERNVAVIAQLCRQLDGIPLAIELAARRLSGLSPEHIASRLDQRFRLLTGGSRTALPRQQALRSTVDWSHDLLSETERTLFRRLSVFAGGWPLEAAEAIGADAGISTSAVLDLLTGLVDKSLVVVDLRDREGRFRLFETLRQYAAERLSITGEETIVQKRHREWYLRLVERAEPRLAGVDQLEWLDRIETEYDNIRLALTRCQADPGGAEDELRFAAALARFWYLRSRGNEGRAWLHHAIERAELAPSRVRAKALIGAAQLAMVQGERGEARTLGAEAVQLAREVEDKSLLAFAMRLLADAVRARGDRELARQLVEGALAAGEESGNAGEVGYALTRLGQLALESGDLDQAQRYIEDGLRAARESGDRSIISGILVQLGSLAREQGRYEDARQRWEEGLALAEALRFPVYVVHHLVNLADLARIQGDRPTAWRRAVSGLLASQTYRDDAVLVSALRPYVALRVSRKVDSLAARVASAEYAWRAPRGFFNATEQKQYEKDQATVRRGLSAEEFATAFAEGQTMTLERAVALALTDCGDG